MFLMHYSFFSIFLLFLFSFPWCQQHKVLTVFIYIISSILFFILSIYLVLIGAYGGNPTAERVIYYFLFRGELTIILLLWTVVNVSSWGREHLKLTAAVFALAIIPLALLISCFAFPWD